jgi:dTDP-4-amino-4,6-dideoxygalactose transaminase
MIYYPLPLNDQEAYQTIGKVPGRLDTTRALCESVLSLPMHTELTCQQQEFIINSIQQFFN